MSILTRFLYDDEGATAVEYAVMVLMVFLACIVTIAVLGQSTATNISTSSGQLTDAMNPYGILWNSGLPRAESFTTCPRCGAVSRPPHLWDRRSPLCRQCRTAAKRAVRYWRPAVDRV